ncbi:TPA: hypothetical protein ACPZF7_004215 [Yersinia enterocolitica]
MKVDIRFFACESVITFKLKDFTNIDDITSIGSAMAHLRSFEAGSLRSAEFKEFIAALKPRKTYEIIVGHDENDRPYVKWGIQK